MEKILISGVGITLCITLGRLLGFFRDILVVSFFGKTYAADMAVLVLTTQDLLLNFFLGSAFSLALMSSFVGKQHILPCIIKAYQRKFTLILIIVVGLLILNISSVINLLAPGLPLVYQAQLGKYLVISVFSIPFTVYAAITAAALNFKEIFILPSLGTAIFNFIICFFIVVSFAFEALNPFYCISIGVVFASLLRWLIQQKDFSFSGLFSISQMNNLNLKEFSKKYLSTMLATSSVFIIPIIARAFASEQGMGQVAIFNLVSKLIDFPITLFSGTVVTILIPRLVKLNNQWQTIGYSALGLMVFFSFALLGTYLLADHIINVIFIFGKFSDINLIEVSSQLKIASLSFPVYGVTFFLVSALSTTRYAKVYGILCLVLCIFFYVVGRAYISNLYDIYIGLIAIYSILCLVGFIIIALEIRFSVPRKKAIRC